MMRLFYAKRRHTFMKIYTENFTILLNKHITNKEIDTYKFCLMYYLLMLSDNDGTCYPSYKTIPFLSTFVSRKKRYLLSRHPR